MGGVGVLHPSDALKSGSDYHRFVAESSRSTPFLPKWRRKKPSPQQNGTSGGGGFASMSSSNPRQKNHKNSRKEKAIAAEATSAPERYAGASFFTSPPPSFLPLPAFLTKNAVTAAAGKNHDSISGL